VTRVTAGPKKDRSGKGAQEYPRPAGTSGCCTYCARRPVGGDRRSAAVFEQATETRYTLYCISRYMGDSGILSCEDNKYNISRAVTRTCNTNAASKTLQYFYTLSPGELVTSLRTAMGLGLNSIEAW
jgi:hypothetical protein